LGARRAMPGGGGVSLAGAGRLTEERGQSALLMLGAIAALIALTLILASLGQALGARGRAQRVADLAAISGAREMRDSYPRLFEPPYLRAGVPNPRHLDVRAYLARARSAAFDGVRRNGLPITVADVRFPDGASFAPSRIAVDVYDSVDVRTAADRRTGRRRVRVRAHAEAGLTAA